MERKFTPKNAVKRILAAAAVTSLGFAAHTDVKPSFASNASVKDVNCGLNDYDMRAGEKIRLQAPSTISGDVIVNGVKMYDNNPETGAETVLTGTKDYIVIAPWGADATLSCTDANDAGKVKQRRQFSRDNAVKISQTLQNGCGLGAGCHVVDLYVTPSNNIVRRYTSAPSLATAEKQFGKFIR